MLATTFRDTIVAHEEMTDQILFHEFVHVLQYERLGTKEFARRYVEGFLTGGSYEAIPLERSAYELDHRFSTTRMAFDVRDELEKLFAAGRI